MLGGLAEAAKVPFPCRRRRVRVRGKVKVDGPDRVDPEHNGQGLRDVQQREVALPKEDRRFS